MNTNRIMAIVAHPDDEVLGCGGTLARLADEGHDVTVVYATGGETSSGHKRLGESGAACEILGLNTPIHLGYEDQKLGMVPFIDLNKAIKDVVYQHRPNIVYTHTGMDLNVDHRRIHEAVMVACRPVRDCSVTELYTFQGSPWDFGEFGEWRANTYVMIQPYMDKKMEAMSAYSTEIKEPPHPQALESMRYTYLANGVSFCLNEVEEFKQVFRLV